MTIHNRPEQVIALLEQNLPQKEIAQRLGYSSPNSLRGLVCSLRKQGRVTAANFKIQPWTQEKTNRLIELWGQPSVTAQKIGEELGYARGAIIGKAKRLGLQQLAPKRQPTVIWSQEQMNEAVSLWQQEIPLEEIADRLGRTVYALRHKLKELGYQREHTWRNRIRRPRRWGGHELSLSGLSPYPRKPKPRMAPELAWQALPDTTPKTFFDLNTTDCRWPIGEIEPHLWCGKAKLKLRGCSYCKDHFEMSMAVEA